MAADGGGQNPKQEISPTVECRGKQGPGASVFRAEGSAGYRFYVPLVWLLRRLRT